MADTGSSADALLTAHSRFLQAAYGLVLPVDQDSTDKLVLSLLFTRLIRMGWAVQALSLAGYNTESHPIARGMLSAALSIRCITQANAEARALQYLVHFNRVLARHLEGRRRHSALSEPQIKAIQDENDARLQGLLLNHAARQIGPEKLGRRDDTWTGLAERDLAIRLDAVDWYDLYFAPFSEEAHVTVLSIARESYEPLNDLSVGPRFNDPRYVILASVESVSYALVAIEHHFAFGRAAGVQAVNDEMMKALRSYVT